MREAFTSQELLTELRRREAQAALERLQNGGIQALDYQSRPSTSPAGPKPNPRLAQRTSQDIFDELLRIQAHWGGTAGRRDWYEVDASVKTDARKVLSLFDTEQLTPTPGSNTVTLKVRTLAEHQYYSYGTKYPLCEDEPYRNQPIGAFCSGVLVAPGVVATAAHCLEVQPNPKKIRFVFDYVMKDPSNAQTSFQPDQVYAGDHVIDHRLSRTVEDWALIALATEVSDHSRVATIRRQGRLDAAERIHAIGHPSGLPVKISADGFVRDNAPPTIFVGAVDVYSGSSGGPIFNSNHVVEGILSRGDLDFVLVGRCARTHNCPDVGCPGAECTRVSAFAGKIPSR